MFLLHRHDFQERKTRCFLSCTRFTLSFTCHNFFTSLRLFLKYAEATKKVRKPKPWKHPQPITIGQLRQMRDEFWDTAPHYGGQKEIWDALRAAAEADVSLAQAIVESAGVIVSNADLTLCYDERGAKYELPKYVLSEPTNLVQDS